jgi:hypothetical protein
VSQLILVLFSAFAVADGHAVIPLLLVVGVTGSLLLLAFLPLLEFFFWFLMLSLMLASLLLLAFPLFLSSLLLLAFLLLPVSLLIMVYLFYFGVLTYCTVQGDILGYRTVIYSYI